MQKNQNQGQPNETGNTQQQRQDVQNESHKPEVENPQPNRKVEEPITAGDRGKMETGSEKNQPVSQSGTAKSGNTAGTSSNDDYQRTEAGFQGGKAESDGKEDRSSHTEKTAQSDKGSNSGR